MYNLGDLIRFLNSYNDDTFADNTIQVKKGDVGMVVKTEEPCLCGSYEESKHNKIKVLVKSHIITVVTEFKGEPYVKTIKKATR